MEFDKFGIADFFTRFQRSGLNNFPELNKISKYQKVDKKKYKETVKTFLKIYAYEIYFFNRPFYFFLGGKIKKSRCGKKILNLKKEKKLIETKSSIGLIWYLRPCKRFLYSFKFKKMVGSSNELPRIEREWKKENDISLLDNYLTVLNDLDEKGLRYIKRKPITKK